MKKFLMAAAAALALLTGQAHATTYHFDDTVTFIKLSEANLNCVQFQTLWTGGVMGIDNSSGGDTGATGYTGTAKFGVFGVGTGTNSLSGFAALITSMLANSRYSLGNFLFTWAEEGTSSSLYGDCASSTNWYAASRFGQ